ncbi:hypothetical protein EMIHUDRAFT_457829, partial [Emiliania huxleyi CCMP1516]|uniref:Uncharacterized protein n=2 Tax=Emiliania huxleyi TaxID=2903 RepID=A0A0D3JKX2_EMIH1
MRRRSGGCGSTRRRRSPRTSMRSATAQPRWWRAATCRPRSASRSCCRSTASMAVPRCSWSGRGRLRRLRTPPPPPASSTRSRRGCAPLLDTLACSSCTRRRCTPRLRRGSAAAPGASRREARPRRRRARGSAAGRWARRSLRRCTGGGRPLWRRAMRASGASRVELLGRAAGEEERRAPLAPKVASQHLSFDFVKTCSARIRRQVRSRTVANSSS